MPTTGQPRDRGRIKGAPVVSLNDALRPHAGWLTWKETVVDGRPAIYGEAGTGPPVIFLHGWGLDHRAYKRALSRLVTAGLHVLAPALPGFGGTASLHREQTSLAGYGDWAARFLTAIGVHEPALVMGHSFGGGVAVMLAHDHPHQVHALVLINSVGGSAWSHHGSTFRSMAERPLWDWGIHLPADILPIRQARRVLPVIIAETFPNIWRDPRAFWRTAGLARRADLTSELDDLRRRRLPVVVLWGQRDQIVTRDSFEAMCKALGTPAVITVPGTHSWLLSDPDEFGEIMTNVLDLLRPDDDGRSTVWAV
ncbi:MAG TPA: alpha/beta hydrolase [Acidimicrobiales bacterium]|nr:alpha/beta hydrolase [Acidimicrobiales bacterium]